MLKKIKTFCSFNTISKIAWVKRMNNLCQEMISKTIHHNIFLDQNMCERKSYPLNNFSFNHFNYDSQI
jgi:hypothetical protein